MSEINVLDEIVPLPPLEEPIVEEPIKELPEVKPPQKTASTKQKKPQPAIAKTTGLPPRKRGKQTSKYVPYEEAKQLVREEMIKSRGAYNTWWETNKPKQVPRFPHRIYQRVWVSWNEFLGTNNVFGVHAKQWRSYEDAIIFVHTLSLSNYNQWTEFCKSGDLPSDVPTRPDLVYANWKSWSHWFGTNPREVLEAKKELERKSHIYYIIHEHGVPENVITFGIETKGMIALKNRWDHQPYDIIRLFFYDKDQGDYINKVVTSLSTQYLGNEQQRIVSNIWEVVYYLEQKLERANPSQTYQFSKDVQSRLNKLAAGEIV